MKCKRIIISTFIILLILVQSGAQNLWKDFNCKRINHCLEHCQLTNDSLSGEAHVINILKLIRDTDDLCTIDLALHQTTLIKTSSLVHNKKAIAGINGGFFDMKNGGALQYLELEQQIISRQAPSKFPELFNAALVGQASGQIEIQQYENDSLFIQSSKEEFVLVAGPILLKDSSAIELPDEPFVTKKHPRTLIASDQEFDYFITIDGRKSNASGMNLIELQAILLKLNLINAMNLDGGGSTTMILNGKIVNQPSDKSGERKVANAIIIRVGK